VSLIKIDFFTRARPEGVAQSDKDLEKRVSTLQPEIIHPHENDTSKIEKFSLRF
jgi:hypothetical protein